MIIPNSSAFFTTSIPIDVSPREDWYEYPKRLEGHGAIPPDVPHTSLSKNHCGIDRDG